MRPVGSVASLALTLASAACAHDELPLREPTQFSVTALPEAGATPPFPIDPGGSSTSFRLTVQALRGDGSEYTPFDGYVWLSAQPGSVASVVGPPKRVVGSSVLLQQGTGEGFVVQVKGAYGGTRLWVEDLGYVPVEASGLAQCSDGIDNDGDGVTDFPADPGCAFADDDTETEGTYATGVSPVLSFAVPTVADIQGRGVRSPWEGQHVPVAAADVHTLVVTKVTSEGLYVTDVSDPGGHRSLFVYDNDVPGAATQCDRLVRLEGTVTEFYGFTELVSPRYQVDSSRPTHEVDRGDSDCPIPEPAEIDEAMLADPWSATAALEKLEASLVRVLGARVARFFGPGDAEGGAFAERRSNCDLDGDGDVDFTTPENGEALCAAACSRTPDCSEWTSYRVHSAFRLVVGDSPLGIQVDASAVPEFDPEASRGLQLVSVTGTLRHFSGGTLNWTIEPRCLDDIVYCLPSDTTCSRNPPLPLSSNVACVRSRADRQHDENEK